jgi:hypothetical protein
MSSNARTIAVFASVLATIGFWMPLSNAPRFGPSGGTITDTYFGVLHYATMHATMKEPDFKLEWTVDPSRLALTIVVTVAFWAFVLWLVRRRKGSATDSAEPQ